MAATRAASSNGVMTIFFATWAIVMAVLVIVVVLRKRRGV
jgi:hypothetical protein